LFYRIFDECKIDGDLGNNTGSAEHKEETQITHHEEMEGSLEELISQEAGSQGENTSQQEAHLEQKAMS